MKTKMLSILAIAILLPNLLAQNTIRSDCNQTVNYKRLSALLPKNFCMPNGYKVIDVFEADINLDEKKDRIIKYYKENWECADTIFLAVYFGVNDSTYQYVKSFFNLCTPMVLQSFKDMEWLVNNCSDSHMSKFAWDNQMWLQFKNGLIIVPFAIDLWNGCDFYFEYDKRRKNWYLTQLQKWNIPDGEFERKYAKDSIIEKVENGICIDDFDIKTYLKPW